MTNESVELWVGNYVFMAYGDGAVMGVPAHDERDFAFAKKYGLPVKQVIAVDNETFTTTRGSPGMPKGARPLRVFGANTTSCRTGRRRRGGR